MEEKKAIFIFLRNCRFYSQRHFTRFFLVSVLVVFTDNETFAQGGEIDDHDITISASYSAQTAIPLYYPGKQQVKMGALKSGEKANIRLYELFSLSFLIIIATTSAMAAVQFAVKRNQVLPENEISQIAAELRITEQANALLQQERLLKVRELMTTTLGIIQKKG